MKTAYKLTIVSSLLLAAGCSAWHERHAKNEQSNEQYSSASTSGSSFQPSATQSTTPQTQTFGQTDGQNEVVTQVQKQLTQDPFLAPLVPNLQISFQNGTVILVGNVPSEQEKNKIETIVKSTTGVANVNNQLQVSSQSQLDLPAASENKQAAVGGTSEQSITSQSTGTQSSQPAAAQSSNEQTAQPPTAAPGQQPPNRSLLGQNALSLTNQSSTTQEQKPQDQNLTPTGDQQSTSRIYNTNQSSSGISDSLGKAASENVNVKVQAATEADRTLGQQVVQELRTESTLAALLPKIRLNVESGKITLSGTVKSEDQKKKIESAVQRVPGVASVEDHLRVSTSSSEDGTTQDNQQESK